MRPWENEYIKEREIYEVQAKVVDAEGNYSILEGYPKVFDSLNYEHNLEKTHQKAMGAYYTVLGVMSEQENQLAVAMVIRVKDDGQIAYQKIGNLADIDLTPIEAPSTNDDQPTGEEDAGSAEQPGNEEEPIDEGNSTPVEPPVNEEE